MTMLVVVIVFLVLFAVLMLVVSLGIRFMETERKKRVEQVLAVSAGAGEVPRTELLMEKPPGDEMSLGHVLSQLPVWKQLDKQIQQAGLSWSPGGVLIACAVLGAAGCLLGLRVHAPVFREFGMILMGLMFGSLPYLWVRWKRRKRFRDFEEQFPEALDFLARSMRAGHAFSVSLEMLADESPDPLGIEFRRVFHEQNLGAPIQTALTGLADRMPQVDVRFFVAAVLLQRETGGNLAEILMKLSYVIRERFRLKGQVRAASAHGRMTAMILALMPMVTVAALMVIAPAYLELLAKDPDGKYMIIGAIVAQLVGYWWMRNIINIKV